MKTTIASIFLFLVVQVAVAQRVVSTHTGTLYWVGRATVGVDLTIGAITYTSIGTSSWYHPDNWSLTSGGASAFNLIPGKSTDVIFDGSAINVNCEIGDASSGGVLTGNSLVCGSSAMACPKSITTAASYTGTIGFRTGWELQIQSNGKLELNAGTFSGNDDKVVLNSGADFILTNSATFTLSTDSKLEISGGDFILNGGTFNHNNATVYINGGTIATNGTDLYNLILRGNVILNSNINVRNHLSLSQAATIDLNTYTIRVGTAAAANATTFSMGGALLHNDLPSAPASTSFSTVSISNGLIDIVAGNLYLNNLYNNNAFTASSSGILKISGSGNQTLQNVPALNSSNEPRGCLPSIEINKPSGTLTLAGHIPARGNWKHVQGNVNAGVSTVYFRNNGTANIDIASTAQMQFNNLSIYTGTTELTSDLAVNGNFTVRAGATFQYAGEGNNLVVGNHFVNSGNFEAGTQLNTYFTGLINPQSITFSGTGSFANVIIEQNAELLSSIYTRGNLQIEESGILDANAFSITLDGHWINYGSFVRDVSEVVFTGADPQYITGNGTQIFHKLQCNKPSDQLILDAAVEIENQLMLTSGLINTNVQNSLKLYNNATILGGSNTSFINGPLRKVGNNYPFTFPVGRVNRYAPVTLFDPLTSASTDEFIVTYFSQPHENLTGFDPESSIDAVSAVEYWDIHRESGTVLTKVELPFSSWSGYGPTDMSYLFTAHYNETETYWEDICPCEVSGTFDNGTIRTTNQVTSYSDFTIGTESEPQPVILSAFNGAAEGTSNVLSWTTEEEINSDKFEIWRAGENNTFIKIGEVKSHQNSTVQNHYYFVDDKPMKGINYYYLKMIDLDLTFEKSSTIAVSNYSVTEAQVIVYPNPLLKNNDLSIELPATNFEYTATVSIIDKLGVVQKTVTEPIKDAKLLINTSSIAEGNYILIVQTPYGKSQHKILVLK